MLAFFIGEWEFRVSSLIERIQGIVEPSLNDMGYAIVRIQVSGKHRITLQVMIERLDDTPLSMDDCVAASRHMSVLLEVDDPISDPYRLEVSSPGIDRPLLTVKDYHRFLGQRIKLQTQNVYEGRKRFRGILVAARDDGIDIDVEEPAGCLLQITYDEVMKANLDPDF